MIIILFEQMPSEYFNLDNILLSTLSISLTIFHFISLYFITFHLKFCFFTFSSFHSYYTTNSNSNTNANANANVDVILFQLFYAFSYENFYYCLTVTLAHLRIYEN